MGRSRAHVRRAAHSYPMGTLAVYADGYGFVRTSEGEFFIPSQVGLIDLQPSMKTEFDHGWHEIVEVKPTDGEATIPLTAAKLTAAFRAAAENHWLARCSTPHFCLGVLSTS